MREAVDYRPGVTDAETTAARALALGAGVCQDHAHVFIACRPVPRRRRRATSPATSTLPDDAEEAARPPETHGWAEAHVEGLGWVGFDPSNGVCPTDGYVRLTAGLDADEASPIRGSVTGGSETTLEAEVDRRGGARAGVAIPVTPRRQRRVTPAPARLYARSARA